MGMFGCVHISFRGSKCYLHFLPPFFNSQRVLFLESDSRFFSILKPDATGSGLQLESQDGFGVFAHWLRGLAEKNERISPNSVSGAHENSAKPYHSHTFLRDFRLELSIPEGWFFSDGWEPEAGLRTLHGTIPTPGVWNLRVWNQTVDMEKIVWQRVTYLDILLYWSINKQYIYNVYIYMYMSMFIYI